MELHLVVNILLDYLGELTHWSTARVLCCDTHKIVSLRKYSTDLYGARTFIRVNRCMVCECTVENSRWITYKARPPAYRHYTVTCRHYHCQISALFSMIRELWQTDRIRVLKRPFQDTLTINVPRSDGSTVLGQAVVHGVLDIGGQPYVMTWWSTLQHDFSKNISWAHYFDKPPEYIFEHLYSE